ncbi:MAG: hypothetical protein HY516_00635 [Candidatus Aenigmarchaeota archaeon]|nr:hypothetical protein [Candidatus Aenigmarchaeota archaeon]
MVASDQVRFLMWTGVFFLVALTFYQIAMMMLPRLIVYGTLPEDKQLYIDNADALATRIAGGVCSLWQSRSDFRKGFESLSEYKVTSGKVDAGKIQEKIIAIGCDKVISPTDWAYSGDVMTVGSVYGVKISMKDDKSKIVVKADKK